MRPLSRIELGDAGVLDAKLLPKQGNVVAQASHLGGLPGARVEGVGSPAAGAGHGELGHGDDVQDGGFDVLGPSGRKRDITKTVVAKGQASRTSLSLTK